MCGHDVTAARPEACRLGAQAAPETNNTISVVVPGQLISPYKQEPMDFIVGIIRTAVRLLTHRHA